MPYFLRFTNTPNKDLERGTSIHASDFATIAEAESCYPDDVFKPIRVVCKI